MMSEKANNFSEILLEDVQVLSHSPWVIALIQQLVPTFHRTEPLESRSMGEEYQIN